MGRPAWGSLTEIQLKIFQVPLSRPLSRSFGYSAGTEGNLPVDHRLLGLSGECSPGIGAVPWNSE